MPDLCLFDEGLRTVNKTGLRVCSGALGTDGRAQRARVQSSVQRLTRTLSLPVLQICPICAALPGGDPNHVTDDFAAHLTLEHRAPRDLISFFKQRSAAHGHHRVPPQWGKKTDLRFLCDKCSVTSACAVLKEWCWSCHLCVCHFELKWSREDSVCWEICTKKILDCYFRLNYVCAVLNQDFQSPVPSTWPSDFSLSSSLEKSALTPSSNNSAATKG